jgi:hypothetical protein
MFPPERIICLTEETVETLYLLGEESRIVGISGYVVRPPKARREKLLRWAALEIHTRNGSPLSHYKRTA